NMTSENDYDHLEIQQQYSRVNVRWDASDDELDNDNSSARLFERSRIKALADEREAVQKKTFTKWVNSHLARVTCRISDLYMDLRDGRVLIKLLEVLSGELLPKPTKGRMRIHCLENVDKALQFLKEQRVHLENMGSHDIVDGNHRLVLGLIWTIILRFQIQDIIVQTQEGRETRSARDALLLWCQMKTAGYPHVNVTNFTSSWKDGLAFNALIHRHRPELVDFHNLTKSNARHNLEHAFSVAERHLGITPLLDPESPGLAQGDARPATGWARGAEPCASLWADVFTENPDEKSIITYVVAFYHYFSKMKVLEVEGRRLGKVIEHAKETERMIEGYSGLASDLLTWIEQTIASLNSRDFANSLAGVQQQLQAFSTYRTVEKPPKFQEKGNLEVLLFTIQSRMRANNQRVYAPHEGRLVSDINRAWEQLEKAEHERELALRNELIRQEKLEQLARRFDRKAAMREAWLSENQRLVAQVRGTWSGTRARLGHPEQASPLRLFFGQDNFGQDLPAVEAAKKKHEAIETDTAAYKERVQAIEAVAKELEAENYHDIKRITGRKDNILRLWEYLLELLRARRQRLEMNLTLQHLFQEMLHSIDWMDEIKAQLASPEFGKHLLEVEDLLQKHRLLEGDMAVQAEKVRAVSGAALRFADAEGYRPCDPKVIRDRVSHLEMCRRELQALAAQRKARLEQSKCLWKCFWELDEAEGWIKEKEQIYSAMDYGKDLTGGMLANGSECLGLCSLAHTPLGPRAAGYECPHVATTWPSSWPSHSSVWAERPRLSLPCRWGRFRELVAQRRKAVDSALSLLNYCVDCEETRKWILSKTRVVESTQDMGRDLAGVLAIQRKLYGIERELAAVGNRLDSLRPQAQRLAEDHPDLAADVRERLGAAAAAWDELQGALRSQAASLGEAGKLQRFLQDLDDFQAWLFGAQKAVASDEVPASLAEAEQLLRQHGAAREDIEQHEAAYNSVKETGERVTQGQVDPEYEQLRQRLEGMGTGWGALRKMWDTRHRFLAQCLGFQEFLRDAKQAEVLLSSQEYTLAHLELPSTLEGSAAALRRFEDFRSSMESSEEKIPSTVASGARLVADGNIFSEKITEKCQSLQERHRANVAKAQEAAGLLQDNHELQTFLQNWQELTLWINEKMLTAQDKSYGTARSLHSKWLKHQAFMAELAANQSWLEKIDKEGKELASRKPRYGALVSQRLGELHALWEQLRAATEEKAQQLFEVNRAELYAQSYGDLDRWLGEMEDELRAAEQAKDLTSTNLLLKRLTRLEEQVGARKKEMEELVSQGAPLGGTAQEADSQEQKLQQRFLELLEPLERRRKELESYKAMYQLGRDLEDEALWVQERLPRARSTDHGTNLQTVQRLMKKNETLQKELAGHAPRVAEVLSRGDGMVAEAAGQCPELEEQLRELRGLWDTLQRETGDRLRRLREANEAQQYYLDASEAEAWISEQELYVAADEKPKDEESGLVMLKRHVRQQRSIEDYGQSIKELAGRAQQLLSAGHPEGEQIIRLQGQMDKHYAGLKEAAEERRRRLENMCHLFQLKREVEDLEQWIAERDVVASSQEMGQDFDHATLLREKFREFAWETGSVGQERVDRVNLTIEDLIDAGHAEAATMAEWKDGLNESWADLLELIDTRRQLLTASHDLHKYFYDASEILALIAEKQKELPQDLGCDTSTAKAFHRMHTAFERDIQLLETQVQQFREVAARLQTAYAGEKADSIQQQEQEVVKALRALLEACSGRRAQLLDTAEKFRFFSMVRDLLSWIESVIRQIETQEKPRDVSSVELLMKYHQGIKAEIDTRDKSFATCIDLGKKLLQRKHHEAPEIKAKLVELVERRRTMMETWDRRLDWLRLLLEVCQFSRDASVAEAWLIAQEPYLASGDYGHTVDSVEKLLKRHEAFEKSTATWEERFAALRKLTTLELLGKRRLQEEPEQGKVTRRSAPDYDLDLDAELDVGSEEEEEKKGLIVQDASPPAPHGPEPPARREVTGKEEDARQRAEEEPTAPEPRSEPDEPSTLPAQLERSSVQLEGYLGRKHDLEAATKRASNRSWSTLYCVLRGGELAFYKDAKSRALGVPYHGEEPFGLRNALCEVAAGYKKKKHVFKLRLGNGSEWLFHGKDEEDMHTWLQSLSTAIIESQSIKAKAQSLPLPLITAVEPGLAKKDKEKRFSFFPKKK
ncbi:SPTB2 protein, partial [Nothocercus nigrocapillus]|nr:SPTB2 protein [Nothocercus nigrocapillus]